MGDGLFVQKQGLMGCVVSAADDERWMLARVYHVCACVHACMCCTHHYSHDSFAATSVIIHRYGNMLRGTEACSTASLPT